MTHMSNNCNFLLRYTGDAVSEGSMDVSHLAPSLLAVNNALTGLNTLVNQDKTKVSLKVNALNKGSFIVDFLLNQDILDQVGHLLTGTGVSAYVNAVAIFESLVQILLLKKWLDGRTPDQVTVSPDHKKVTFFIGQQSITVNYITYLGYQSPTVNSECSKIVEPLHCNGVDSITLSDRQHEASFSKSDLSALQASPADRILTSNVSERVVTLETAAFKDHAKWKVRLGDFSVFVSISDREFLEAVDNGSKRFGKGDVLLVQLRTTQTLSDGRIVETFDVEKVLQHKASVEQLSLF